MAGQIDGPGNDNGLFTVGNPFAGIPATVVTAEWLNDVQQELVNFINATAQTATKGVQNQVLLGVIIVTDAQVNLLVNREVLVLAPFDVTQGQLFGHEELWGVAKATVLSGNPVTMQRMGQFTLPKQTGQTWLFGETLYVDDADPENILITNVSGAGKKRIGHCAVGAGSAATTGSVYIDGNSSKTGQV